MVAVVFGGFLGVKWGGDMATRKTGIFKETKEEIEISLCDVCGKDIEKINEKGEHVMIYPEIEVCVTHKWMDDNVEYVNVCSYDCLARWAQCEVLGI